MAGFREVGEREVYRGHILRTVVATFVDPDGDTFERDVVRSPGAVGIVPLQFDVEGNPMVVLVQQYRPSIDAELQEIPAGMRDVDGEPPEQTAHRELAEECGLAAGRMEPLLAFHNSAGMTDAVTHVYLALDLTPVPRQLHGPEEAHMTVQVRALSEVLGDVEAGRITDAKTVIGVLLAERWLAQADGSPR